MSGVSLTLGLDDPSLSRLKGALDRFVTAAGDLRRPFELIGAGLVDAVAERFGRGIGPDGVTWQKSLRAQAEGGQTLVDRGRLRQSITHRAGGDRVEVGTKLIYAGIHQFGGATGRGHAVTLPARPYLGLDGDDAAMILGEIEDWLAKALR